MVAGAPVASSSDREIGRLCAQSHCATRSLASLVCQRARRRLIGADAHLNEDTWRRMRLTRELVVVFVVETIAETKDSQTKFNGTEQTRRLLLI